MDQLSNMAQSVAALLKERGQTVAVSESAAGGLISAALLSIPGASAYFVGGGVIYTRDARAAILGYTGDQITQRGATEDYALQCARTIRDKLGTDWGIGESGASGPSGNRYGDDAGHVALAVAGPTEMTRTVETGSDAREDNMWAFAAAALELLEAAVKE